MLYDLSNPLQAENFKKRCNALYKKKGIVELTEKHPQRTISQNSYLHAALGYFALEYEPPKEAERLTAEEVKRWYFKETCNPDLFVRRKPDPITGESREELRSSKDLDTAEMTTAIDRFRAWAETQGVYIPSPEEHRLVTEMEIEVQRNRNRI